MGTHESYVSLKTAKMLKEAGFDWGTKASYWHYEGIDKFGEDKFENHGILADWNTEKYSDIVYLSAPTLDVAQRWLRENKDFDINILTDFDSVKRLYYVRYIVKDGHYKTYYITNNQSYVYFNTYEEAQEAGVKKALELILEK